MASSYNVITQTALAATTNNDIEVPVNKAKGFMAFLRITASSGTPTLDVSFQMKDPLSGTYVAFSPAVAFAQKTGTGNDTLTVYPGLTSTANRQINAVIPDGTIRVVQTVGGGTPSLTYTLAIQWLT